MCHTIHLTAIWELLFMGRIFFWNQEIVELYVLASTYKPKHAGTRIQIEHAMQITYLKIHILYYIYFEQCSNLPVFLLEVFEWFFGFFRSSADEKNNL